MKIKISIKHKTIITRVFAVLVAIVGIALTIALTIIVVNFVKKQIDKINYEKFDTYVTKLKYKDEKSVELCLTPDSCDLPYKNMSYKWIKYDYKDKKFQEIINNLNEQTDKFYNETLNSNLAAPECAPVVNKYKYRTYYYTIDEIREDNNIISINRQLSGDDMCVGTVQLEPYIANFSKETGKVLSTEEMLKLYKITDKDVVSAIEDRILQDNLVYNYKKNYEQTVKDGKYTLYLNIYGNLYASYYDMIQKEYTSAKVKELGFNKYKQG